MQQRKTNVIKSIVFWWNASLLDQIGENATKLSCSFVFQQNFRVMENAYNKTYSSLLVPQICSLWLSPHRHGHDIYIALLGYISLLLGGRVSIGEPL